MRNSIVALAFGAFAALGTTSSVVIAQAQVNRADALFARLDADKSGDISAEEFAAVPSKNVSAADKDGDGKTTAEEMAATFKGDNAAERAAQVIKRFDADADGAVTPAEVEARRKTNFAKLDTNSDGKLVKDEMPKAAAQ